MHSLDNNAEIVVDFEDVEASPLTPAEPAEEVAEIELSIQAAQTEERADVEPPIPKPVSAAPSSEVDSLQNSIDDALPMFELFIDERNPHIAVLQLASYVSYMAKRHEAHIGRLYQKLVAAEKEIARVTAENESQKQRLQTSAIVSNTNEAASEVVSESPSETLSETASETKFVPLRMSKKSESVESDPANQAEETPDADALRGWAQRRNSMVRYRPGSYRERHSEKSKSLTLKKSKEKEKEKKLDRDRKSLTLGRLFKKSSDEKTDDRDEKKAWRKSGLPQVQSIPPSVITCFRYLQEHAKQLDGNSFADVPQDDENRSDSDSITSVAQACGVITKYFAGVPPLFCKVEPLLEHALPVSDAMLHKSLIRSTLSHMGSNEKVLLQTLCSLFNTAVKSSG